MATSPEEKSKPAGLRFKNDSGGEFREIPPLYLLHMLLWQENADFSGWRLNSFRQFDSQWRLLLYHHPLTETVKNCNNLYPKIIDC